MKIIYRFGRFLHHQFQFKHVLSACCVHAMPRGRLLGLGKQHGRPLHPLGTQALGGWIPVCHLVSLMHTQGHVGLNILLAESGGLLES